MGTTAQSPEHQPPTETSGEQETTEEASNELIVSVYRPPRVRHSDNESMSWMMDASTVFESDEPSSLSPGRVIRAKSRTQTQNMLYTDKTGWRPVKVAKESLFPRLRNLSTKGSMEALTGLELPPDEPAPPKEPGNENILDNTIIKSPIGQGPGLIMLEPEIPRSPKAVLEAPIRTPLLTTTARPLSEYFGYLAKEKAFPTDRSIRVFGWILHSQRPLTVSELFLATSLGVPLQGDLSILDSQLREFKGLLSRLLLRRMSNEKYMKPLHKSYAEFLKNRGLSTLSQGIPFNERISIKKSIAQSCISYLSSERLGRANLVLAGSSQEGPLRKYTVQRLIEEYPFLEYACRYVLFHIDDSDTADIMSLLKQLGQDLQRLWRLQAFHDFLCCNPYDEEIPPLPEYGHKTSLLSMLALKGYSYMVNLILNPAEVNEVEEMYGYPLQAACIGGSLSIVKGLLASDANVNAKGGRYGNALQAAAIVGSIDIVNVLLDAGADVNISGGFYGTAIQAACLSPSVSPILTTLLEIGAESDALQAATASKNIGLVNFLLSAGADVNKQGGYYGNALQAAAVSRNLGIVKILLAAGADVNSQGGYYGNALQAATVSGSFGVVVELIAAGANINNEGGHYEDSLAAACFFGHFHIVRALLEARAETSIQDVKLKAAKEAVEASNAPADVKNKILMLLDSSPFTKAQEETEEETPLTSEGINPTGTLISIESGKESDNIALDTVTSQNSASLSLIDMESVYEVEKQLILAIFMENDDFRTLYARFKKAGTLEKATLEKIVNGIMKDFYSKLKTSAQDPRELDVLRLFKVHKKWLANQVVYQLDPADINDIQSLTQLKLEISDMLQQLETSLSRRQISKAEEQESERSNEVNQLVPRASSDQNEGLQSMNAENENTLNKLVEGLSNQDSREAAPETDSGPRDLPMIDFMQSFLTCGPQFESLKSDLTEILEGMFRRNFERVKNAWRCSSCSRWYEEDFLELEPGSVSQYVSRTDGKPKCSACITNYGYSTAKTGIGMIIADVQDFFRTLSGDNILNGGEKLRNMSPSSSVDDLAGQSISGSVSSDSVSPSSTAFTGIKSASATTIKFEEPEKPNRRILYLCVSLKKGPFFESRFASVDLLRVKDDAELFRHIRLEYAKLKGKWQCIFSLHDIVTVRFVHFSVSPVPAVSILHHSPIHNGDRENPVVLPRYDNVDYVYKPIPVRHVPPVPHNDMLYRYHVPDDWEGNISCHTSFPGCRHVRPALDSEDKTGEAWGIEVVEGWRWKYLWLPVALITVTSLFIGVLWGAFTKDHDFQTGFTIAGWLVSCMCPLYAATQVYWGV